MGRNTSNGNTSCIKFGFDGSGLIGFGVVSLLALTSFKVLLDDLLVREDSESNSMLLAILPASNVSTSIIKEINTFAVLQVILIISVISSPTYPNIGA